MKKRLSVTQRLSSEALDSFQRLGGRLKQARKIRGWSGLEVAARCGIDRATLAKAERGTPTVSMAVVLQLLDIYGMLEPIEDLADPSKDNLGKALSPRRSQDIIDRNF